MNQKIITIFMTVFMLIMCIGLMTTFQFVNAQKNLDLNLARTDHSVLSTDGEVKEDTGIKISGDSLISCIKYKSSIDSQRTVVGKDKIFENYKVYLGAEILTEENVENLVDKNSQYTMMYNLENYKITVKRG